MKHLPVVSVASHDRMTWAASAMISGRRDTAMVALPPRMFCTAAVAIVVRGQRQLTATGRGCVWAARPRVSIVMPYLLSVYSDVRAKPVRVEIQWRREREDMRVVRPVKVRQHRAGHKEGAPRVDIEHEVEPFERELPDRLEREGGGVVHERVNASKGGHRLSTARAASASLRTSPTTARPLPPSASICSTAVRTVPGSR